MNIKESGKTSKEELRTSEEVSRPMSKIEEHRMISNRLLPVLDDKPSIVKIGTSSQSRASKMT
jgi:hypothetical protein